MLEVLVVYGRGAVVSLSSPPPWPQVYHGEFKLVPSSTGDLFRSFSSLYDWLSGEKAAPSCRCTHTHSSTRWYSRLYAAGDMTGRFIFDLGQSLYEGGRPQVGSMMMR